MIGVEETTQAGVARADAGDDEITDDHGCGDGAVMLVVVGHFGVPESLAAEAIEGDDVGMVGDGEEHVAANRHATVEPDAGVSNEPWSTRL